MVYFPFKPEIAFNSLLLVSAPITPSSLTASKIVNEWSVAEIADVLFQFGDEKRSRQIAREIVASRPLNSTGHLVQVISRITSFKERPKTLARCFQVRVCTYVCVHDSR